MGETTEKAVTTGTSTGIGIDGTHKNSGRSRNRRRIRALLLLLLLLQLLLLLLLMLLLHILRCLSTMIHTVTKSIQSNTKEPTNTSGSRNVVVVRCF